MQIKTILGISFSYVKGPILSIGETKKIDFNGKEVTYERKLIIRDFQEGVVVVKLIEDYVNIRRKGEIIRRGNEVNIEVEINNNGDFIAKDINFISHK